MERTLVETGIYIHIPFCKHKCNYCDFYSVANRNAEIPQFIESLVQEIHQCRIDTSTWTFRTLFLGGGTPSLLEPPQLEQILLALNEKFNLSNLKEISMEANPGEAPKEKLRSFRSLGINRLSIGVQSFQSDQLAFLSRWHTTSDSLQTLDAARKAGYENISCDLIFNIPGQSFNNWQNELAQMVEWGPDHLSCYSLTVEEPTPLFQSVMKGEVAAPSDSRGARMFHWTRDYLGSKGYDQYEISNYARPGKECLHNLQYWRIYPYLGFGPSAHGYDGNRRWNNVPDLDQYMGSIRDGLSLVVATETITRRKHANEIIGFGLRTREGVALKKIPETFRDRVLKSVIRLSAKWADFLYVEDDTIYLTPEGRIHADAVAVDLMILEP